MKRLLLLGAVLMIVSCAPVPVKPEPLPLSSPAAPSFPTPFPSTPELCPATKGNLNIRQAPKYNSPVLGWFDKGEVLTVQETISSDWWRVAGIGTNPQGKETVLVGYVRSSWVTMGACQEYVQKKHYIKRRSVYLR